MIRLKFYGLGGQGVVTAAKVLSAAVSIHEGKYAVTIPAYGHERRGAPVYTDVVVDNEPILLNCFVYEPDIVLVMDPSVREKILTSARVNTTVRFWCSIQNRNGKRRNIWSNTASKRRIIPMRLMWR